MATLADVRAAMMVPPRTSADRWRRRLWASAALLVLVAGVSRAAPAADKAAAPGSSIADASLVADADAIAAGVPFMLAIRLQLPAGWHTYWSNPGEAGAPTHVDWRLPEGFAAAPVAWPTPERITAGNAVSYGYKGDVWLTARITPPAGLAPGTTAPVAASVDWLACAEICVPEQATLTLALPVEATARPAMPATARAFAAAAARLPQPGLGPLVVTSRGRDVLVAIPSPGDGNRPGTEPGAVTGAWFFPHSFGQIDDAAPQALERDADGLRLRLTRPASAAPASPELSGVLVLDRPAGRSGYEVRAQPPS